MPRVLDCIKGLALTAVIAFCCAACVAAWRISELAQTANRELPALSASVQVDAQSAAQSLATAAEGVQDSGVAVRAAAQQLQAEMVPIGNQVNLDLQETHRLLLESGLTATEARQASVEERAALPGMTAKADASLDSLTAELQTLHTTTLDLDHLIDDPANVNTEINLSQASGSMARAAQDGELWVHGILHPSWPHRVYHVGLDLAHALIDPF